MKNWMMIMAVILLGGAVTVLAATLKCPIDDGNMTWTGKTQMENGKILKEYKCLQGHVAWSADQTPFDKVFEWETRNSNNEIRNKFSASGGSACGGKIQTGK